MALSTAITSPEFGKRFLEGALCFGVSLLTGPMIRDAITVSRMVRRLRPELPIVYGGWHPSLQSADTLREDFVDVVDAASGRQNTGGNSGSSSGCGQHSGHGGRLLVQEKRKHHPESGPAGRSRSRIWPRPLTILRILTSTPGTAAAESFLRDEYRLPVCLQLLHRYGLLQSAL